MRHIIRAASERAYTSYATVGLWASPYRPKNMLLWLGSDFIANGGPRGARKGPKGSRSTDTKSLYPVAENGIENTVKKKGIESASEPTTAS